MTERSRQRTRQRNADLDTLAEPKFKEKPAGQGRAPSAGWHGCSRSSRHSTRGGSHTSLVTSVIVSTSRRTTMEMSTTTQRYAASAERFGRNSATTTLGVFTTATLRYERLGGGMKGRWASNWTPLGRRTRPTLSPSPWTCMSSLRWLPPCGLRTKRHVDRQGQTCTYPFASRLARRHTCTS